MQHSFGNILLNILEIIRYTNDKEKFILEFENLNQEEAILNILERLPDEIQEKIRANDNIDEIKQYINQEEFIVELRKVSGEALGNFIEDIAPTLTLDQSERILKLISPKYK